MMFTVGRISRWILSGFEMAWPLTLLECCDILLQFLFDLLNQQTEQKFGDGGGFMLHLQGLAWGRRNMNIIMHGVYFVIICVFSLEADDKEAREI